MKPVKNNEVGVLPRLPKEGTITPSGEFAGLSACDRRCSGSMCPSMFHVVFMKIGNATEIWCPTNLDYPTLRILGMDK